MKLTTEIINEKVEQLRRELIDMVEPKFELNRWYKYIDSSIHLVCFTNLEERAGYGFNWNGWTSCDRWSIRNLIPAAPSEVQQALEAEAIKRGFVKGVKIQLDNFYHGTSNPIVESNEYEFTDGCLTVKDNQDYNIGLFKDGKWATIIPTEKTSEEWVNEYYNSERSLKNFLIDNNLKIVKK